MTDVHMVLRRLRDEPYGVRHVRTGAAALELLRKEGFYAVLIDHRLPDMPGTKVCRKMRENGVTAPIIILSSLQDEGLADAAMEAGATDYLAKDIVMPDLARFLDRRLAMRRDGGPRRRPAGSRNEKDPARVTPR